MGRRKCAAVNCDTTSDSSVALFGFPRVGKQLEERYKLWAQAAGRPELTESKPYLNLCALHFDDNQFTNATKTRLIYNAVPSSPLSTPVCATSSRQLTKNLFSNEESIREAFIFVKIWKFCLDMNFHQHLLKHVSACDVDNCTSVYRSMASSASWNNDFLIEPSDERESSALKSSMLLYSTLKALDSLGAVNKKVLINMNENKKSNKKRKCIAANCRTTSDSNVALFYFPKVGKQLEKRYKLWAQAAGKPELIETKPCLNLCALHFDDNQFTNATKTKLIYNAVPSVKLSASTSNLSN